jgi:hypothetical protein
MKLYGDSTGLAAKNISSSKRPVEELKLALGNLFLPELTAASLAFYQTVSGGQKWIRSHTDELNTAAGVIADFSQGLLYATGIVGGYVAVMGTAVIINNGFAASFGIFTSLFVAMQAQLSLTGAAATVTSAQFNAMGVSVATSAQVATVGVLSLKAAMTVLSGFMIGWEIGKWWASFESGAKTGVYIVHALAKTWDWVAEAAERAWLIMKGQTTGDWTGVMGSLDKIGKKYEAIAKTRSAALAGSLDAAGKPMATAAGGAYKESPAEVAANAARIAAQRAKEEADQAKAAGAKLAEQWADTKRTLEGEMNLSALTGLDKTLQEITNKAIEYRSKFGDKSEIAVWEEKAKAAAVYTDEMERLTTTMSELDRVQDAYFQASIDALPKEAQAVARLTEEYRKKQYAIQDALKQELITPATAMAQAHELELRQAEQNLEILNQQEDAAYAYQKSLEKLGKTGTTVAEDMKEAFTGWASNMAKDFNDVLWGAKVTFNGILESFGKMITQMLIQKSVVEPLTNNMGGIFGGIMSAFGGGGSGTPAAFSQVSAYDSMVGVGGADFAMAGGGVINEPVFGRGLRSGSSYAFGENGAEVVLNQGQLGSGKGEVSVQVNVINQTGQPVSAKSGGVQFDGKSYIVTTILEDIQQGGPLRGLFSGARA